MRASNEVSAKEFAEFKNVTPPAVSKAIETGRLKNSIISKGKDGYVIDKEKASYEWENNRQRKTPTKLSIDELEANTSHTGDYPTQQESIQRKENALAEIAKIKYQDMLKDRYEFQKIEKIILKNVPESQEIEARRVINEFRELIKKNIDEKFTYSIKEAREKKEYYNSHIKACELSLMQGEAINLEEIEQLIIALGKKDIQIDQSLINREIEEMTQQQINLLTD